MFDLDSSSSMGMEDLFDNASSFSARGSDAEASILSSYDTGLASYVVDDSHEMPLNVSVDHLDDSGVNCYWRGR